QPARDHFGLGSSGGLRRPPPLPPRASGAVWLPARFSAARSRRAFATTRSITQRRRSREDMEAQPFGDERRLVLVLDLDAAVHPPERRAGRSLADAAEPSGRANAAADAHRAHEPDLVEAVVQEELRALDLRDEVEAQVDEQRQRQKTVRDRAAERR